jgi:hypothetical protein
MIKEEWTLSTSTLQVEFWVIMGETCEGQPAGGPCSPKKVSISRWRNCPFSQERAELPFLPRNIFSHQGDTSPLTSICQNLLPQAIKKPIKPNFQSDSADHQFPGPAAWPHAPFPFSSLQIKLLWPLLLKSTFDFYLRVDQGPSPP